MTEPRGLGMGKKNPSTTPVSPSAHGLGQRGQESGSGPPLPNLPPPAQGCKWGGAVLGNTGSISTSRRGIAPQKSPSTGVPSPGGLHGQGKASRSKASAGFHCNLLQTLSLVAPGESPDTPPTSTNYQGGSAWNFSHPQVLFELSWGGRAVTARPARRQEQRYEVQHQMHRTKE